MFVFYFKLCVNTVNLKQTTLWDIMYLEILIERLVVDNVPQTDKMKLLVRLWGVGKKKQMAPQRKYEVHC